MTPHEISDEAFRLYNGEGCEADVDRARELFIQAARGGDVSAAVALGGMAFDDEDWSAAHKWYTKAFSLFDKGGRPADVAEYVGFGHFQMGKLYYHNLDHAPQPKSGSLRQRAFDHLRQAYELGDRHCLELLGCCYHDGEGTANGKPDQANALKVWKEGMEAGDNQCVLRYCTYLVEHNKAGDETVERLERLVQDPIEPVADACAVLYLYYSRLGDDDLAAEWLESGLDMGSKLMDSLLDDARDELAEDDDWVYTEPVDMCVIVVDTQGNLRVERADATDRQSIPTLIDADRVDNMRCNCFRDVSDDLDLSGTLLGLMDKDAARKPDLKVNRLASKWFDGADEVFGDLIVCMEDSTHEPYSFASEEEALQVIEKLRG